MKKLLMNLKNYQVLSVEEQQHINGGLCSSLKCTFSNGFSGVIPVVNGSTGCSGTNGVLFEPRTICAGYFNRPVCSVTIAGNNCGGADSCPPCPL